MPEPRTVALVPTPAELLAAPELAMGLPVAEAAALLARVGALEALLRARLTAPGPGVEPVAPAAAGDAEPDGPGAMLTASEAAAIARVHSRVVYGWSRRADWRAFAHRLSRKVLRIEERGFRRWLDRQGAR